MKYSVYWIFFILIGVLPGLAQQPANQSDGRLIQFSGLLLTADSLRTVPYALVQVVGQNKGAITNAEGFFSFVAKEGDSIRFSAVGFKPSYFEIPKGLTDSRYTIVKLLSEDTIMLPRAVIHAWPTPEQLNYAFVNMKFPDDDLERARKNLERETMKEIEKTLAYDGRENQRYYYNQQLYKYYYAGQPPPIQLLNPFAWAKFFEAWQRGDFKKK